MKLRFHVNQAECLRRGIDCHVTVDVNPAQLTDEQRNLIADRLTGIDVMQIRVEPHYRAWRPGIDSAVERSPYRISANLPTFDSLMEAIAANEETVRQEVIRRAEATIAELDGVQRDVAATGVTLS